MIETITYAQARSTITLKASVSVKTSNSNVSLKENGDQKRKKIIIEVQKLYISLVKGREIPARKPSASNVNRTYDCDAQKCGQRKPRKFDISRKDNWNLIATSITLATQLSPPIVVYLRPPTPSTTCNMCVHVLLHVDSLSREALTLLSYFPPAEAVLS